MGILLALLGAWLAQAACPESDSDCARREKLLSATGLLKAELESGLDFDAEGGDAMIRFNVRGLSFSNERAAGVSVASFDAVVAPDEGGFRIRFSLLESEIVFFCKDPEGSLLVPPLGLAATACEEEESYGLSYNLFLGQWDTETGRGAIRWADVDFVYNLLANGNGKEFLQRYLLIRSGLSLDTVWPAGTQAPGGVEYDPPRHPETSLRLNLGISGMLRTKNNKWELKGYAYFRPAVTDLSDWGAEARVELMHHRLLGERRNALLSLGPYVSAAYYNDPAHSIGSDCASDREKATFCGGLRLQVLYYSRSR